MFVYAIGLKAIKKQNRHMRLFKAYGEMSLADRF